MGLEPTVPRTPSVPKYLRVILESLPYGDHVLRFLHLVDPEYFRAALQREQSHGEAAGQALACRPAGDVADGRLSRQAGQQRNSKGFEFAELSQYFHVV